MSVVDLSKRWTDSYEDYQRFSSSSDSLVFISGLTHSEDVPASVDLCVGNFWFDCQEQTFFRIPEEGIELPSGRSAVLQTLERVALPKNVFGLLSGKGTLIFQGMIVSPGKIDPGFDDHLKIGVFNAGPKVVRLETGAPFCSCSFFQMESLVTAPRHRAPEAIPQKSKMRTSTRIKRFLQAEWSKSGVNILAILALLVMLANFIFGLLKKGH